MICTLFMWSKERPHFRDSHRLWVVVCFSQDRMEKQVHVVNNLWHLSRMRGWALVYKNTRWASCLCSNLNIVTLSGDLTVMFTDAATTTVINGPSIDICLFYTSDQKCNINIVIFIGCESWCASHKTGWNMKCTWLTTCSNCPECAGKILVCR